ncbi:MAG: hypothetical protein G8345_20195 [Magnetococcales bacterium]|nr:hypothetical protein [Magnetococcales bacterium]NGZ29194.1 hypothetical protein [Magnetococcales bacterium]
MLLFILTTLPPADASWVAFTAPQLVQASEMIVVGKLVATVPEVVDLNGYALNLGVIHITQVLKGVSPSRFVTLELPSPTAPRSSSDLLHKKGQNGMWFLRLHGQEPAKRFIADHPQRFVADTTLTPAYLEEIRQLIGSERP